MKDPLIAALRQAHPGIDFRPATDSVVEHADLETTGNRACGANIYIATHSPPDIDLRDFRCRRQLRVGETEAFTHCELRCFREAGEIVAALFDASGTGVSHRLRCRTAADEIDEALLAWLGPLEDICTPWSDNDPPQCQVITVDRLRAYGQAYRQE
mgnify:CR=1 FL=1